MAGFSGCAISIHSNTDILYSALTHSHLLIHQYHFMMWTDVFYLFFVFLAVTVDCKQGDLRKNVSVKGA